MNIDANQSVGIGLTNSTSLFANSSAKLEIQSTTKGFLPPRTNTTASIISPAQGLLTYITASGEVEGLWQYRTGSGGWVQFLHNSSSIPASSVVGLNLSRIATGSITASVDIGTNIFNIISGSSTLVAVNNNGNVGIRTPTIGSNLPNGWSSTGSFIEVTGISNEPSGIFLRRGSFSGIGLDMWSQNNAGASYIDNRYDAAGTFSAINIRVRTSGTPRTVAIFDDEFGAKIGDFTNNRTNALRVEGDMSFRSGGGARTITGPLNTSLIINALPSNSTEGVVLQYNGTASFLLNNNGRVIIQNGGTFADAGYRLDVIGTARFNNSVIAQTVSGADVLDIGNVRISNAGGGRYIEGFGGMSMRSSTDTGNAITIGTNSINRWQSSTTNIILTPNGVGQQGGFIFSSSLTNPSNSTLTFSNNRNDGLKSAIIRTADFSAITPSTPIDLYIFAGKETVSTTQGNLFLAHDGTDQRGNVIIGSATNGAYKLDVSGSTRVSGIFRQQTNAGNNYIELDANANATNPFIRLLRAGAFDGHIRMQNGGSIGGATISQGFDLYNASTSNYAGLIVANMAVASGSLGVVNSTGGASSIFVDYATGGSGLIRFTQIGAAVRGLIGYDGGSGTMQIRVNGATTLSNGTLSTSFFSTGNVGINTLTDAGFKLDVSGSTRMNGDTLINGVLQDTITTNRQVASYSLVLADRGKLVEMNVASANTLTVPLNSSIAFPIGSKIDIAQYGAGQTTIVATGGVTIRSTNGWLKLNAQYAAATLIKIATDEWYLFGNLNA
jgi:hypothetical protein